MSTSAELLDADYLNDQGLAFDARGQVAEALACYRQALSVNPSHAHALNNLGTVIFGQGQLAEAAECFRQALRSDPNHVGALTNLGYALFKQGQVAEALACYRQALAFNPNQADTHNNLGIALEAQGQLAEALACYRQALCINPQHADAHYNLGNALIALKQLDEGILCFRQALAINPNDIKARTNLGNALKEQGHLAEAVACYQELLRLDPGNLEAHNNLAIAYKDQGQLQKAEECFARALALDAGSKIARWNRSLVRLSQGDFAQGWPDYELRWAQPGKVARVFQQPRWDGSAPAGKTILVYAEQGLGDTLQFVRYLPMIQRRGGSVVFECQPALFGLLTGITGADQIIRAGDPLPPFDAQIPLLSLPRLFGTTLLSIPADIPYVHADTNRVEHWRKEIVRHSLNVGIVWQGNPRVAQHDCWAADQKRSIPLDCFEPLARLPGVRLFSLQKGHGTEQLKQWKYPREIIDLDDRIVDFMDTAAIMMNLDLIISSCTSPLHLAGALGRPVWAVLQFSGCWRWLLDREDSPWYPTLRLFRQRKPGDWNEVFERIAGELRELV